MAINSNLYVDLLVALTSNRKVKHVLPQIKHKKALGMKPSRGLMKKKIMSIIGRQEQTPHNLQKLHGSKI